MLEASARKKAVWEKVYDEQAEQVAAKKVLTQRSGEQQVESQDQINKCEKLVAEPTQNMLDQKRHRQSAANNMLAFKKTSEQAETLLRVPADKHAKAVELLAGHAE